MPNYARIEIVGHTAREATFGRSQSGKDFARFSVAVNNPKKPDDTTWFNVFVYNEVAISQAKLVRKGGAVIVRGIPRPDKYEKDNVITPQITIWANEVYVIDWRKKQDAEHDGSLPF